MIDTFYVRKLVQQPRYYHTNISSLNIQFENNYNPIKEYKSFETLHGTIYSIGDYYNNSKIKRIYTSSNDGSYISVELYNNTVVKIKKESKIASLK